MAKRPITILGINPGSRYIGMAVFRGPELRDWRVKVIKGKWSKEKMKKLMTIVSDLIERYRPRALAIKKLHPSRTSPDLDRLVARVKALSQRKGIRVCEYSIGELEAFFCPWERTSKRRMAEVIASQYPIVLPELTKEKGNKNPYHLRMFEAVALGARCFFYLDKH